MNEQKEMEIEELARIEELETKTACESQAGFLD